MSHDFVKRHADTFYPSLASRCYVRHPDVMSVQDVISSVVRLLMALRGETQGDVAAALELPRVSVVNRLAGRTRWTSDDLDRLASHFQVPVSVLVTPTSDLVSPTLAAAGMGAVTPTLRHLLPQVTPTLLPLEEIVERGRPLDLAA